MVNGHLLKFQFKWIFSENINTTKEKLPFKPPFSVLGVMAFMGHFPFPFPVTHMFCIEAMEHESSVRPGPANIT